MSLFGHSITRRGALRAAGVAGAMASVAVALSGCEREQEEELPNDPVVVDDDTATVVTGEHGDFSFVEVDLEPTARWELPLGNVIHAGEGDWLPVLTAGASASPVVIGSSLQISTGTLREVVPEPVNKDIANVVIYDVRCSDAVYAWVELDTLTRAWSLYASSFAGGALVGSPTTLWRADADWAPPRMAITGNRVIWQVMPALGGSKTTEPSVAYLWHAGEASAIPVVESPGRFATAPAVSGGSITLTPRVRADEGVFYGITAYSVDDDLATTIDRLVMPQTVRPFYAVRIGDAFAFSVEANYSSGGLLGNMGTYFGVSDGTFANVPLEPYADVAGTSTGLCAVKSRASYYLVDTAQQRFAVLGASNRCVDYGEYPARVGETSTFVTYATVKDIDTGYPSTVVVRAFDLPPSLPEPAPAEEDEEGVLST